MSVDALLDRQDRPAYVTFHRVAVESPALSLKEGRYVAVDVDYVHVTPNYSKDVLKFKVKTWISNMENDMRNQRLPKEWFDAYMAKYEAWKRGEELPLNGTPIKGWGVISPAIQETLIHMNVMTVEDAALMNDEAIKRLGMGGLDVKVKAKAWLAQLNDKGALTLEMSSITKENNVLKGSVESLQRQVDELMKMVQKDAPAVQAQYSPRETISANDILDDSGDSKDFAVDVNPNQDLAAQYEAKFGQKPHHRMKQETIIAALKD
jgi:hypothetical protein